MDTSEKLDEDEVLKQVYKQYIRQVVGGGKERSVVSEVFLRWVPAQRKQYRELFFQLGVNSQLDPVSELSKSKTLRALNLQVSRQVPVDTMRRTRSMSKHAGILAHCSKSDPPGRVTKKSRKLTEQCQLSLAAENFLIEQCQLSLGAKKLLKVILLNVKLLNVIPGLVNLSDQTFDLN